MLSKDELINSIEAKFLKKEIKGYSIILSILLACITLIVAFIFKSFVEKDDYEILSNLFVIALIVPFIVILIIGMIKDIIKRNAIINKADTMYKFVAILDNMLPIKNANGLASFLVEFKLKDGTIKSLKTSKLFSNLKFYESLDEFNNKKVVCLYDEKRDKIYIIKKYMDIENL